MSKYSNLKFFDSNSDELNLKYDATTQSWSGVVYLPEVSVGLYETLTMYMLEVVKGQYGDEKYVKPITPAASGVNNTILVQFGGGYDTSIKSDNVNNDISLYTTTTVVNSANIPELYIKHEDSTKRTRNPQSIVTGTSGIFDTVLTSVINEPIQINIALKSNIESYHKRTLSIDELDASGTITHNIATIRVYGETVAEDERLEVLLSNIGMSLSPSDHFVFEDANLRESSPDWKLINRKRRELLLEAANIKPFIGTYKALLNAIKYFGYENITLKEYYLNINEQAENFGKLKAVAVPNQESKGFLAAKGMSVGVGPNSNLKKTSRFSLVYRLNNATGKNDEWDIPEVKEALDFSPDEVLIKLYGLKNRLQKSYIPMHAKIVDIVGEGDYFSQFNINTWNNQQNIYTVNEGVKVGYELFPKRSLFLEDLRKVSPLFTGLGQDFTGLMNQYGSTSGPVSLWELADINTSPTIVDSVGFNNATMIGGGEGIDTVFAVGQPAASTTLYAEDASTWSGTGDITYDDVLNNNVVGRQVALGQHPRVYSIVVTDHTAILSFTTTLNNAAIFGFTDTECILTSVTGLRPAGEITLSGGETIRYSGITGNKLTGCTTSMTSGFVADGTATVNKRGFWEISGIIAIPAAVVKGAAVSNTSFSTNTPPQTNTTRSISFNPNNQHHIKIPHSASLNPKGSLTVSAWVRHDDWIRNSGGNYSTANNYQMIVGTTTGSGTGGNAGGWDITMRNGRMQAGMYINGLGWRRVFCGYNKFNGSVSPIAGNPHYYKPASNGWHMITMTFDGRYLKLYIDGKIGDDGGASIMIGSAFQASPTVTTELDLGSYGHEIYYNPNTPGGSSIGAALLWVGSLSTGSSNIHPSYEYIWDGQIDDVAIWDTPLSGPRVAGLYANWDPASALYSMGDNPVADVNNFYTNYTNTDLSTFSESDIPVGCPITLKANTLLDKFDDCLFTWEDGEDEGELTTTWDKWWHRNVYEIEWRLQGPTMNGVKYDRSFRGSIDNFYEIAITLPYIGMYSVQLSFYDLYNVRSVKFEKESIEVRSKNAETYAITQQFIPKKSWGDYNKHTWSSAGSDWNVSNENEEEVQDFTGSYYLTLDRANYANTDSDWRKSTIVRYTDGVNIPLSASYPTIPNFLSTEGPYVWKNLKKHSWDDGETMSWETTIIGADVNPSFSFDITDTKKVKITMNYYVGTSSTLSTDSYTVSIAPVNYQDLVNWDLIADELNSLSSVANTVSSSLATSVSVNNAATAGAPTTIISPSAAGLTTLYAADATNYIATGTITYNDSANTGVTATPSAITDLTAVVAPPSAASANGAFTTGATSMLLTGTLTAWPSAGVAVIGGKAITYSAITSQTLTVIGDTGSITSGATVSTIQGYWQITVGAIPAATLSTQALNGLSNGYATGGATITLLGTLTAWPTVGTITLLGRTITYGSIVGQVLNVTSDTVLVSAPILNTTTITSYVNATNPQLSKFTYNTIKVATFNPLVATLCNEILAVANGADKMHDFDTVVIDPATGDLLKSNHLIPCNPTHDNVKLINQHEIHNKLNHFTFSYDNTKVPGVKKQEWTLKNNSKNIDDIYYNNRWLPFVFTETGDYTLKLKLTDVNGNEIKTTKNILTIK